jgi:hypothetical protein
MASHLEHEMNTCLSEMEQLQEKMMELQKKKEEKIAEEKKKNEDIEPNMEMMAEWLRKSKENEELVKKVYSVTGGQAKNASNFRKWQDQFEEAEFESFRRCFNGYDNHPSKPVKKYEDVCQFPHLNGPARTGLRLPHGCAQTGSQQEFMMNFVETTFNMFQIQQKRIDELEMKLHT